METPFRQSIGRILTEFAIADPFFETLLLRWKKLNFNEREEYIVSVLNPPGDVDWETAMTRYELLATCLRGEYPNSEQWLFESQVRNLAIIPPVLASEDFNASLVYSMNLWLAGNYELPVMRLLKIFNIFTNGDFLFAKLNPELATYYTRVTLLLFVQYFAVLPQEWQAIVLNSVYLELAIVLGVDLGEAFRQAIDKNLLINERRENSLLFATMIYDNRWQFGLTPAGMPAKLSYWIDRFRIISGGKFDGMSFIDFLNQKNEWIDCTLAEKMTIKEGIVYYVGLLSDKYLVTTTMMAKVARANVKKTTLLFNDRTAVINLIDKEFEKDLEGNYKNLEGVLNRLNEISEDRDNPEIANWYYFDEETSRFKWKE